MDSATEELRRQHIKTLEVLRRFADENARLREENAQLHGPLGRAISSSLAGAAKANAESA